MVHAVYDQQTTSDQHEQRTQRYSPASVGDVGKPAEKPEAADRQDQTNKGRIHHLIFSRVTRTDNPASEILMSRHIAIYIRVSTKEQDTKSQEPDLKRWVEAFADGMLVRWYSDKATGRNMDRPGWQKLEPAIDAGKVEKLAVWRMDRLGRTASGLTALFEKLQAKKIGFESLRDRVDLSTPAGRLLANVLASVAVFENEVRGERIRAGQAAARARGKTWGGSQKGRRIKVTTEQVEVVRRLKQDGMKIAAIARAVAVISLFALRIGCDGVMHERTRLAIELADPSPTGRNRSDPSHAKIGHLL